MDKEKLGKKITDFMLSLQEDFKCNIRTTVIIRPLDDISRPVVVSNDDETQIKKAVLGYVFSDKKYL